MTSPLYLRIRPLVAWLLYYSGLAPLARWWTQRSGPRVIILNYHRAVGGHLRRHLLYLKRHYRIVPLETALAELYAPDAETPAARRVDRRTPLAITFDDGYYDNYTEAAALARELRTPITIFLIPDYISTNKLFLWQEAEHLLRHAQVGEALIEGRAYRLDQSDGRVALMRLIDVRTRYAPSVAEREAFLTMARQALGVPADSAGDDPLARAMTWPQAHEMEAAGWVMYGAHTMHHPVLSSLTDATEVRYEVAQSRTTLERELRHDIHAFAYPYGKPWDIGQTALEAVRAAGYAWAVTTSPGVNTPQTDPLLLRRVPTDASEPCVILAVQAAGVWWTIWDTLTRIGQLTARLRAGAGGMRRPAKLAGGAA